jgi:hypothetical protein
METNDRAIIEQVDYQGLPAVVYQNGSIRLTVLPGVGAKIVSLIDLRLNREWMSQPSVPVRALASLTDEWEKYDRSGWDECFPSVGGGFYPTGPWAGTPLRGLGELWHRPWKWDARNGGVATRIYGLRFPYEFKRHAVLRGPVLDLNYSVENLSEVPFLGAWSMHPLLAAQPGMRILLPTGAKMVIDGALEEQGGERYRERIAWPWLGQDIGDEDLSSLRPASKGHALKLFTERHEVARAALCDPGTGAWVGVEVDREIIPHFGVWVNEGRWPVPEDRLYHVALEPTTGFADNLETAAAVGSGAIVPALGVQQWRVSLEFGTTADEAAAFVAGAA